MTDGAGAGAAGCLLRVAGDALTVNSCAGWSSGLLSGDLTDHINYRIS